MTEFELSLDDIFARLKKEDNGLRKEIRVPFKFLDSYTKEDKSIFYGRESETEEIFRKLYSGKLLLIYGKSGTGKSSIIDCGLISRIPQEDIHPVNIRCGNKAYENFVSEIKKYSKTDLVNPLEILEDIFYEHSKPVALIFDQFEEVFIISDEEERKKLARSLNEILKSRLKINIILVIREEYFANLTEFEEFIPGIYGNRIRIERMSKTSAKDAIIKPCETCNTGIENGLADLVIEQLLWQSEGVELTWLQILMDKLYRTATERDPVNPFIKNEDLTRLGRIGNVLSDFLDEQLRIMQHGDFGEEVLKTMISADGTKKQVSLTDISDNLQARGHSPDQKLIEESLRYLIDVRIIADKNELGYYELRHDAIANRIYERMTTIEKELIEVRQFIDNEYSAFEKRGKLLTSEDLKYIAPYESRLYLSKDLTDLIKNSKNALAKVKRRRRNFVAAAATVLLLVLTGFSLWALLERNRAIEESKHSKVLLMIAKAKEESITNPTNALRYAQLAYRYDSTNALANQALSEIYHAADSAPFYTSTFNHNESVFSAIFSPDSKNILTASDDKTAKLWDLSGKCLATFSGHISSLYSAVFSPDGKTVLTSSVDKTAILWDLSGKCLVTFSGHSDRVLNAVFSKDGKSVLTASRDKTAKLWDLSGRCLVTFSGHTDRVLDALFSPDGKTIVTASRDKTARLWDLSGKCLTIFSGHSDYVWCAVFSPDCKHILTGSYDNSAKLWDLSGKCLATYSGHTDRIYSAVFSSDSKNILTGSYDFTAKLWDLSGKCLTTFRGHKDWVYSAFFSPDGKTVLTSSYDRTAKIWDLSGKCLATLAGHKSDVNSAVFSPDGKYVVTGSFDKTAKLWDLSQKYLTTLSGHTERIAYAIFSNDGKNVLTSSADKTAKLWDLSGKCLTTFSGHTDYVYSAFFSPNDKLIITCSDDKTAKLWDPSGKCLATLSGHKALVYNANFSPDGKTILTSSADMTAKIWDLSGKCLTTLTGHKGLVSSIVFSIDGKTILTSSSDKTAKIWDLSGKCLATCSGHSDNVYYAFFSPDNKSIITCSKDRTARLWDLSGKCLSVFSGHSDYVYYALFSPNGKSVITSSADNTAKLWDLSGKCLATLIGHTDNVYTAVFSPDGKTILTASYDNTAKLWDLKGKCLSTLSGHKYSVYFAFFSPDGKKIVTSSYDNTAKLWYTPSAIFRWLNVSKIGLLLPSDKAEINELDDFNTLRQSNDLSVINEYAKWYLSIQDTSKAEILYERSLLLYPLSFDKKVLGDIYLKQNKKGKYAALYKNEPEAIIKDEISGLPDISEESSYIMKFNLYSDRSKLYERLLQLKTDGLNRYYASSNYFDMGRYGIFSGKYSEALDATLRGIELYPSNELLLTNLPLCYIFTEQTEKAKSVYLEYKDKPFTEDAKYNSFEEVFLADIADLESKGLIHPYFEKVKDLLKK